MLIAYCLLIMFLVAFAMFREGLFNAVLTTVNVLLAGLLTFEFWEPLADLLDEKLEGTTLRGLEDAIVMVSLFTVFLIALRWGMNSLSFTLIKFEPNLDHYGGAVVGVVAGYLLSGFLVCVMETLPWQADFLGFTPRHAKDEAGDPSRRYLPPDRVWLALMHRAGTHALAWRTIDAERSTFGDRHRTFDPDGTFEQRYLRYRRYGLQDGRYVPPLIPQGELPVGR